MSEPMSKRELIDTLTAWYKWFDTDSDGQWEPSQDNTSTYNQICTRILIEQSGKPDTAREGLSDKQRLKVYYAGYEQGRFDAGMDRYIKENPPESKLPVPEEEG